MKKNLLKLLTIVVVGCCFLTYACSSSNKDSSLTEEQNALNSDQSASETSQEAVEDVLDIEKNATSTENTSESEDNHPIQSLLSSVLSSVFNSLNNKEEEEDNDATDNATLTKLKEVLNLFDNHFSELNNESLNEILENLKDGEASEQDLNDIKSFLKNNGIDLTNIKLTNSEKDKIFQYVTDNKDKIKELLTKYKLNNLDQDFISSLINILFED